MKKITLLLLLITSFCYSQGTTLEEYNYITKGYKIALDSGLDLKQGYQLTELYNYDDSGYNFDFKLFQEKKTNKTKAIMVIAVSKVWNNKYYLCIPINNNELNQKYYNYLGIWDKDIIKSYTLALSQIVSLSAD